MSSANTHVLIVDDDALLREFLAKILRQYDISSIRQTASLSSASEILRNNAVDLVFLDIQLNDENGLDALPDLTELSPSTNFVMVSAHSSLDNAKQAIQTGAKGFIVKPFTQKKVAGVLDKLKLLPATSKQKT